ncbi:hypothetical protein HU200_056297 [Digitaria exilis]|uniref:Uncharacterized protein n=1 Tax=Digitaria exilis TaxID=1010633 RepID=A0A835AJY6_9POAL|nr:hypothetical protein HU200_056297 [Digitaria exilis]
MLLARASEQDQRSSHSQSRTARPGVGVTLSLGEPRAHTSVTVKTASPRRHPTLVPLSFPSEPPRSPRRQKLKLLHADEAPRSSLGAKRPAIAASQGPVAVTASRFATETARGRHAFEIASYSVLKGFRQGDFVQSATFAVGGIDWCINYLPNGNTVHMAGDTDDDDYNYYTDHSDLERERIEEEEENLEYISLYLEHPSGTAAASVLFDLRVVNPVTGLSSPPQSFSLLFDHRNTFWGSARFIKKSDLEASYVGDDRLVIECIITVIIQGPVSQPKIDLEIKVPPSNMLDNLGELLESGKRSDVTFKVKEEVIHAHKFVLAMRSPVFEAELYGPMTKDKKRQSITVEDMEPDVFMALLWFIYTDSLPAMEDLDLAENEDLVKHLLVTAAAGPIVQWERSPNAATIAAPPHVLRQPPPPTPFPPPPLAPFPPPLGPPPLLPAAKARSNLPSSSAVKPLSAATVPPPPSAMAPSERPTRKTVSRCVPETDGCTHVLEIVGYSLHKDSAAFAVGGHEWCLRFYPNGDGWEDTEGFKDSVSLYLAILGVDEAEGDDDGDDEATTKVRALYDFRFVNAATGVSTSVYGGDHVFRSGCTTWGSGNLMEKSELQASYLRDDRLVIECDVTVVKLTERSKPVAVCDIQVPPSALLDDLGKLLGSEVGADVRFEVKSEVFYAHKIVLAARSMGQ